MKDVDKLLAKVFNEHAALNIVKDFQIMSANSKLKTAPEMMKLCQLWFALGHINSMDNTSHFIRDYHGSNSNGETH
jgi:hypothetical protein